MLFLSLVGSASYGVSVNFVTAESILLKNAWGKISNVILIFALSPLIYLYNLKIRKIEEEKQKIKDLEEEQDKLEYYIENNFTG